MSGWIKLHRSLKDWEWYDDHNATRLLIHLLLTVNYEPKKWKGMTIEPGTIITSFDKLAQETGLSVKQIRVAMKKCESSGEVARKRARKGQAITLTKWEKLQSDEEKRASNRASRGQEEGKKRATTKEGKESKEREEVKKEGASPAPQLFEFLEYAQEKSQERNLNLDQVKCELKYQAWKEAGWRTGKGTKIKNWKSVLLNTLPYIQKEKGSGEKESFYDKLSQIQ